MNPTQAFLGEPDTWTHVRLTLRDVHGLWGGRTCFVWGTGRVIAQIAAPTQHEDRYTHTLAPGEIVRLVMLLIETDFTTITFPRRPIRPDEACPVVTLTNPAGEQRSVHKWAADQHPGFDSVYQLLCAFADRAQQGEHLYHGPYDPNFSPVEVA